MTNKKIKITESQYDRLINLMVETPFDTMAKNSIQDGDIVSFTWRGNKNNFKVINNTSGQIIMDNIDKGSANINFRYLMTYTSLDGDDIQLRRVHKTNEADKLNDPKTWATVTVKDITDIKVIRDGKVVDRVDPVSPSAAKQQNQNNGSNSTESEDFIAEMNNKLLIILEQLQEGKGLNLKLNNAELLFCCNGKSGGVFDLEITENKSLPTLNKWRIFVLEIKSSDDESSTYEANKDIIKTTDNGETFSLKFKVFNGEKESEIWITNCDGVAITKSCNDKTEDGEIEVDNPQEDELKFNAKEAFEKILSDPTMQKAFYSQPKFWQAFVAELKGEKHPGTGIITVLNIVKNYEEKQVIEQVGSGFTNKKGLIVEFVPLEPITLNYTSKKEGRKSLNIKTNVPTEIKTSDDKREIGVVLEVNLTEDPNHLLRVVVEGKTETENIKECRLIIGRISSNNTFIAVSSPITTQLEFLNSEGYKIPKEENTK